MAYDQKKTECDNGNKKTHNIQGKYWRSVGDGSLPYTIAPRTVQAKNKKETINLNDIDKMTAPTKKKRRKNIDQNRDLVTTTLTSTPGSLKPTQVAITRTCGATPTTSTAPNNPNTSNTLNTAPRRGKISKLNGYQVYFNDEYVHGEQVYNKAKITNNNYILTSSRARLVSYGFVRKFTQSLSMDIASIVNDYYGNDCLIVDIRHPQCASLGKKHSQVFSTLLFDLDGVSMTTSTTDCISSNESNPRSTIVFSVELVGESKCETDSYGVGMWCYGYSSNVLKTNINGEYYRKEDFFNSIVKRGEFEDEYRCKHNTWKCGLPKESEIYSKIGKDAMMGKLYSYSITMDSISTGLSGITKSGPNILDCCYKNSNDHDDGWHPLKFGVSTLYWTFDFKSENIIIERKDGDRNNGEKQHIDTYSLVKNRFYIFSMGLRGCNCQDIEKGGMMYRIKIQEK